MASKRSTPNIPRLDKVKVPEKYRNITIIGKQKHLI